MLFNRSLLQQGQYGKWLLILAALSAVAGGLFALFQAQIFSEIIRKIFFDRQPITSVDGLFLWLGIILTVRAILLGCQDIAGVRAAFRIKQSLREQLLQRFSQVGIVNLENESSGEISQILIDGIDALEPYFAHYLPQVFVAFLVPPILCLAVFVIDPLSGAIFLVTAPLIPLFMRLIADVSQRQTLRQWERLSLLSAFLLDALRGLATIKRVGKSAEVAKRLTKTGEDYRDATLETLRTTFLSALVMELLSTLSTALVAVQVGLRLLYGWISFEQALFVLVLAPEFYLPLRLLGQRFHAGMNGVSAWERIQRLFGLTLEPEVNESHLIETGKTWRVQNIDILEILLQGVSFTYPQRGVILQGVNGKLVVGKITVLIGESGSGKTTLLNLLLRLLRPSEGQILINGESLEGIPLPEWWEKIGYVPQYPFLFQGTIRENIAFAKPEAEFDEIRHAATLAYADEFITRLPQGYDTLIGENGYGLSAGEKQRLILARAYLKGAPLLIFDESTANVDPQSLEKILRSLQKNAPGRVILIVSHQPQVWAFGQRFWVLKNGSIQEIERDGLEADHFPTETTLLQGSASPVVGVDRLRRDSPAKNATETPGEQIILTKLSSIWQPYLTQMWSLRGWILLAVLLGWAAIFSNVGLMSTSAYIISFAALQPSIALLQTSIVGVRFFGISRAVFRYLERLSSHRVTLDLLSKMRVWFYRALEPRVPQIFGRYTSGEMLSRLIGDIASLEPFYVRAVSPMLVAVLVVVAMAFWLWAVHPALAWVGIAFYLIAGFVVLPVFYYITARRIAPNNALRGDYSARLVLFLQGLTDLRINQRLEEFRSRLNRSAQQYGSGLYQFNAYMSLQGAVMTFLGYGGMWFILWMASRLVEQGRISGLLLAGLGLGVLVSFEAFLLLPQAVQHLVTGGRAFSRLSDMVNDSQTKSFASSGVLHRINEMSLQVENVSFCYPWWAGKIDHTTAQEIHNGVRNVSFTLSKQRRLGIVGPSGSGKTTIINLLLGMFPPDQGAIFLDGKPLEQYDLSWWRSVVASCAQDDYLFQTTLRENLLFLNRKANEERIWQALEAMKLAEFVHQLPHGLDTYLGEQGKQLSGGERQRLLLARTLLRDAPLYLFDEPTANLDPVIAKQVIQNILDWTTGRALLLISHQAIGFDRMDEILVLEAGEIVQRGTHEELLNSGGYYTRLWLESSLGERSLSPRV
ncbi:MAG: thiol reductant ABC exporter subunit CydD [Anaerolineales bacterium]